jgi:hypothetical protein
MQSQALLEQPIVPEGSPTSRLPQPSRRTHVLPHGRQSVGGFLGPFGVAVLGQLTESVYLPRKRRDWSSLVGELMRQVVG